MRLTLLKELGKLKHSHDQLITCIYFKGTDLKRLYLLIVSHKINGSLPLQRVLRNEVKRKPLYPSPFLSGSSVTTGLCVII